jgi:lipid A 3-O-deacylase
MSNQGEKGLGRNRSFRPGVLLSACWAASLLWPGTAAAQSDAPVTNLVGDRVLSLQPPEKKIWHDGVGEGFEPSLQSISLYAGAGPGFKIFGSSTDHDLALAGIVYGYMWGPVQGKDHWYRGNWEFRGELFGGEQFYPSKNYVVGLTPHLRYNFATGTRWIPFVDAGAGVSATSIGPPDLSTHTFEFNVQAATGVRWFIRDDLALGVEARFLHLSCASIYSPNLGLNNVNGLLTISWFF